MRAPLIRFRGTLAISAALALILLAQPEVASAATPNGSQFQVNTYTTGTQYSPSVATNSAGSFVVVWESYGSPGTDTSAGSVQGQRYDASGSPIGAQFQVNTYTSGSQVGVSVASDRNGNFVVVWESQGSPGSDTSGFSVQGQRYDASGTPIGAQFQVNTYTSGDQGEARVASDSFGNFVVVWMSFGSAGGDTSSGSVQGQRYNASGTPIAGQFQVNTYTTGNQGFPFVTSDPAGNFVVVWTSVPGGVMPWTIEGQVFNASGSAVGSEFQVNSYTEIPPPRRPSVASDSAGNFVVVWGSYRNPGTGTASSVQGQRYDASGSPIGAQFQVNTYTSGDQGDARVASDSFGDFIVVWTSFGSAGGDTSSTSVQGQAYSSSGSPVGAQFQVNTSTTGPQGHPSVASDSEGASFVVAWASAPNVNYSIYGQRYLPEPSSTESFAVALAVLIGLVWRRRV